MAVIFDTYELDLKFDNKETDSDPASLSFSIKDSIHKLYPTLTLEIKDILGGWQEYLLTSESIPIKISFGLKNDFITCPFVLTNEEITKLLSNSHIAGENRISALHEYYDKQEVISAAYKNKISSVIQELTNKYSDFEGIDIDSTVNNTYWYQPFMNDATFMNNILLPNAYSYDSNDSPFFLFIGSNNTFNLKHYKNLVSQRPIKKLFFVHEDLKDLKNDVITSFKKFKTGSQITKHTRNRKVFKFSKDDGTMSEESDGITSYPIAVGKNLPLFSDDKISSIFNLDEDKLEVGDKENLLGQKVNSMKDSLFLERFLITTYLDTNLVAGKMIEIEIPHFKSKSNDEVSLYFSDKFLIEEADHVWDTSQKDIGRAYTQLLVSRKFLPSLPVINYNLVEKLQKS